MNWKKISALAIFVMVILCIGLSIQGVSIGPSQGDFKFSRQGGTLQWSVFNIGDKAATFKVLYGGPAAAFASDPSGMTVTDAIIGAGEREQMGGVKKSFTVTINGNDFKSVYFTIRPPANVEYGKKYPFYADAILVSTVGASGSGVGVSIGASALLNVIFEDKGGPPTEYRTVDELATREAKRATQAKETNWLMIALLIAIVIAILITTYLYYKKKKEEEEES